MTFAEFLKTVPGIILVQGIGFVAMAFHSLSYQQKKHSGTLIFQGIASFFWMAQLLLLGAWTGVILNVVNIFRGFLFAGKDKHKWIASKFTLWGILGVFAVSGAISFYLDGPISIIPTVASFIQTFGLYSSDKRKLRFICMAGSVLWIVYNSLVFTLAGILCEVLNVCSILISIWRFRLSEDTEKNSEQLPVPDERIIESSNDSSPQS